MSFPAEQVFEQEFDREEEQGFVIDTPDKADWAIEKIKEDRARCQMFVEAAEKRIEKYQEQIAHAKEVCNNDTSFLVMKLKEFMDTVPTKKTKTQETVTLPAGRLVFKYAKQDYVRDDGKVTEFVKDTAPELLKVTTSYQWAELKKDLSVVDGQVMYKPTGEMLDCITAITKPAVFEVE